VLSDADYVLLHEVRIRGFVEIDECSEHAVLVAHLTEVGYVAPVRRAIRITNDGRVAHAAWARVDIGSDVEQAVVRGYNAFLPLNAELLQLCNDWQVRPGKVPNDHSDRQYDWSVIDRLRALDERAAPVLRRVARVLDRFDAYPRRLRAALRHVDEGETEWFTSPRIDSYHTVWMQVHEDLLLALGRDRADE
jgi:hypothetical protein